MPHITDVAREAGVSVATVSRVLTDAGYPVRAETRERVLAAAVRLGYQPNRLGRSLRTGRSNAVGVCATTLNNPTATTAIEGIIQACRAENRQVQVTTTFSDPRMEHSQLQLFLQERVAGVISFPSGAPADGYLRLQAAGAPVVLLNRRVPGLTAPLIRHDFAAGYAMAVERLAARGHRRIGAILSRSFADRAEQIAAWHAAFERFGLEPRPDLVCDVASAPDAALTHRAIAALLDQEHPPTAVYAGTAMTTLIALRLIQTAGAPERRKITLVGTGDLRWELLFPPTVAFVCLDSYGLGKTAATLINGLIDGVRDVRSDQETVIGVRFVEPAERLE